MFFDFIIDAIKGKFYLKKQISRDEKRDKNHYRDRKLMEYHMKQCALEPITSVVHRGNPSTKDFKSHKEM